MQNNIAHMEHQARDPHRSQHASLQNAQFPQRTSSAVPVTQAPPQDYGSPYSQSAEFESFDGPNSSPFPVLRDPPPNVPPTSEQREASLETARDPVLSSNDPEMQLAWAQDALVYVEVAKQNEARLSLIQPPRPQTPAVERQLRVDAMNIVDFLANQYHPRADFIKGTWLEFGKFGFRVDKKEAFRAYSRAAEKGYARAEYRMGMQFESSGEPAKAIKHYERGVSLADSASYYVCPAAGVITLRLIHAQRLGMMILLGQHGQRQDYQLGLDYIRMAADSCDENAPQGAYVSVTTDCVRFQANELKVYGMLLARELPQVTVPESYLPRDFNAARVNVEKAAYHGFAKAQVKMGASYELCQLGCDFSPELSLHYNALAARQGEPEAEMAISKWFLCGHEGVFDKNEELAFTYAQRAAQSGFPTAEFALGYFYEVGLYVPTDIKEARSWYAKAAASGNRDANNRIDSISRSKTLTKKDHEKVAISRIKSRRGNTQQPISENIEMPDPSRMSLSDNHEPPAGPYQRPLSRVRPGRGTPDPRPSSAFGINPNLQSNPPNLGPPPQPNRAASYGPGPMGYHSGAGSPSSSGPGSPATVPSSSTPKLDVGYSAPLGPPERKPVRTPVPGHPPSSRMSSPRPPGSPSFAPRMESRDSSTPKPPSAAHSAQSQKPSAQPAKPPGKGPKTFEEMGVPTAKKDNDCVCSLLVPILILMS